MIPNVVWWIHELPLNKHTLSLESCWMHHSSLLFPETRSASLFLSCTALPRPSELPTFSLHCLMVSLYSPSSGSMKEMPLIMMGEPRTDGDSPSNLTSFTRHSLDLPDDFGKDLLMWKSSWSSMNRVPPFLEHFSVFINYDFVRPTFALSASQIYTWSRHEVGSSRSTCFINFFHMGAIFCVYPVRMISSTFSDKNNPCLRCTKQTFPIRHFFQSKFH